MKICFVSFFTFSSPQSHPFTLLFQHLTRIRSRFILLREELTKLPEQPWDHVILFPLVPFIQRINCEEIFATELLGHAGIVRAAVLADSFAWFGGLPLSQTINGLSDFSSLATSYQAQFRYISSTRNAPTNIFHCPQFRYIYSTRNAPTNSIFLRCGSSCLQQRRYDRGAAVAERHVYP